MTNTQESTDELLTCRPSERPCTNQNECYCYKSLVELAENNETIFSTIIDLVGVLNRRRKHDLIFNAVFGTAVLFVLLVTIAHLAGWL